MKSCFVYTANAAVLSCSNTAAGQHCGNSTPPVNSRGLVKVNMTAVLFGSVIDHAELTQMELLCYTQVSQTYVFGDHSHAMLAREQSQMCVL